MVRFHLLVSYRFADSMVYKNPPKIKSNHALRYGILGVFFDVGLNMGASRNQCQASMCFGEAATLGPGSATVLV